MRIKPNRKRHANEADFIFTLEGQEIGAVAAAEREKIGKLENRGNESSIRQPERDRAEFDLNQVGLPKIQPPSARMTFKENEPTFFSNLLVPFVEATDEAVEQMRNSYDIIAVHGMYLALAKIRLSNGICARSILLQINRQFTEYRPEFSPIEIPVIELEYEFYDEEVAKAMLSFDDGAKDLLGGNESL